MTTKIRKNAAGLRIEENARAILGLLAAQQGQQQPSYETMAAALLIDRRDAIVAVKRLELLGQLKVRRSRGGGVPNQYELINS